jgi:hypothetical protein
MKILLLISFLVPLIYIWYLISKLGDFLEGKAVPNVITGNSASAIVLGSTKLAKHTTELLEDKGFQVVCLTDPFQLTQERKLCYLFALSESDADNIAFYKIGKKLYCLENLISICNDKRNESMFISENINYLLSEKTSAVRLIQLVLQQPEVMCESKCE